MKSIVQNGKNLIFGRLKPSLEALAKIPKFSKYLGSKCEKCGGNVPLPTPPDTLDYSLDAMTCLSLVMLNNQLGDCTCAGAGHQLGLWTGNAGNITILSDAQVLAIYKAVSGYDGTPATDVGANEVDVLNYLMTTGYPTGNKIVGYCVVDPTNPVEVKQAMWLAESLYFGVGLPSVWVNPFPSGNGFVWDAAPPNDENGHCFVGTGYGPDGVSIDTWGLLGTVTWAAMAQSVGQLYALFSTDSIAKASGKSPAGFDWATLQTDFAAMQNEARGGLVAEVAAVVAAIEKVL